MFAELADALRDVAGDDSKLYADLHSSGALSSLPVLRETLRQSYGGWFGPNAPGADVLTPQFLPLIFFAPDHPEWSAWAKSIKDAIAKAEVSLHMDPLQLRALGFAGQLLQQTGGSVNKDLGALLGEAHDFLYSMANSISGGLLNHALDQHKPGAKLVDQNSDGYKAGAIVGGMVTAFLQMIPGTGVLVQIMHSTAQLMEALEARDQNGAREAIEGLTESMNQAAGAALIGGLARSLHSPRSQSGNRILGGARAEDFNAVKANIRGGRIDCRGVVRSTSEQITGCFGPGTLLQAPYGPRRIEEIDEGELVLASPEDGVGEPRYCAVEHVFRRYAAVIEIHVLGGVIKATPEHPFWVEGGGWTTAWDLRPGDALRNEAGTTVVLSVVDRGEAIPVYNLSVAEYHTYYVLPSLGEAGVWSHNARYGFRGDHAPKRATSPKNGLRKSYVNRAGDLRPSSLSGKFKGRQVSVGEHILGGFRGAAKAKSPFISVSSGRGIAASLDSHGLPSC